MNETIASSTSDDIFFSQLIRPSTMRSTYWKYFGFPADEDGNILTRKKIICACCNNAIAYNKNTTNLKAHLNAKHPEITLNIKPITTPTNFIFSPSNCDSTHRLPIIDEPPPKKIAKYLKEDILPGKANSSNDGVVVYTSSDSDYLLMETMTPNTDTCTDPTVKRFNDKETEENPDYLVEYVTPNGDSIGELVTLDSSAQSGTDESNQAHIKNDNNDNSMQNQHFDDDTLMKQKSEHINGMLIEMLIETFLPINIVTGAVFNRFCKSLNKSFQPPTSEQVCLKTTTLHITSQFNTHLIYFF